MKHNTELVEQVEEIVTSLSSLSGDKKLLDKKGNLDIEKFNNHQDVVSVKKELTELGVNNRTLNNMGFTVAAMLLKF